MSWGPNVPQPVPTLTYGGADITPMMRSCRVQRPFNGKSTLSVTLGNPLQTDLPATSLPGEFCPPGYGDFADIIRQHNRSLSFPRFQLSATVAGEEWRSVAYYPNEPSFDGTTLQWGGEDATGMLEAEGMALSELHIEAGTSLMAHSSVQEIATAYGITIDARYPDYMIGQMSRNGGSAIACLDRHAKPMQGGRRWERIGSTDTLIYEQAQTEAPVAFRLVDRKTIHQLNFRELTRPSNSWSLSRFEPAGTVLGQQDGTTIEPDRGRINFETPARSVQIQILKATNGQLINWVYFSADGAILAGDLGGGPPLYAGAGLAAYAEFTYRTNPGATAFTPGWEIVARGGGITSGSTNYNLTAEDAALITWHGANPERRNIDDPAIFYEHDAQASIDAYKAENIRKVWGATFGTPYLNPFIQPGQIIEVVDYLTRQSAVRWFVEMVTFSWDGLRWYMVLECTKGL
jgi:hypothetical protein